ncbi:MAG: methyltransferase domain-containing protein [Phycisphaerae bacterium]|nr:methyltransferase domain-containing protein [Phycisphaerae bacterium]
MQSDTPGAKKYFNRVPKQWDALYSHENPLKYLINKWLRKGLYWRYQLVFEQCGTIPEAKVLDIGCGTGRYSIEFAKRGAGRIVGIDFAPSMVDFSREIARQMEVADKCEFICGDFMTHQFEEPFDIILAVGVFDYVKDPGPMFKKIAQLKPRKFLASFPKFTLVWGTQRAIRYYWIKKCPIYNYTEEKLTNLYREAGFSDFQIISYEKGFFGIATTK